jgi:type VI secretion system protein VasG
MNLKQAMEQRIVGQSHALEAVAQAIQTSRAKLTDPRKPIGVFLMVGTSGTGKTETALTLANLLYGGEQNVTTINMTEFKEEHKVSLLMGSPPGYVGYGEGGILTEAVRRRPYSVLLLDEMEKAHPGVQDVFFQVFDKGAMKDGEGRDIDFKNTVIIMTSNAGTDLIAKLFADPETAPDAAGLADALRPELMKYFRPAFLGRLTLVPYFPLSDAVIRQIVDLQLDRVRRRVWDNYRAGFDYDVSVAEAIAARCRESSSGARNVENILSRTLLPELSAEVLARLADGSAITRVSVSTTPEGSFRYNLN